ncbi:hypothetical protein [Pseudomonas sp. FEN]|uniref:hypothetical protein n=1 Tax=Pseudomonas sp. FEN TaxID=2767468 RepID=UPI001CD3E22D|nr:hypothetical protein [Pseudomonas sp. FEN]
MHEDDFIPHPVTGLPSYGLIPGYSSRNLTLPAGEIYLRVGKHVGVNKGFGVNHIWQGHGHELPKWGCKSIHDVAMYVATICSPGAQILCEFHLTADGYRLTLLKSAKGCVILSPQLDTEGNNFYSVVTAYKLHRSPHATKVGTLKAKKEL